MKKKICILTGVIISFIITMNIQGYSNSLLELDEFSLLQIESLGLIESDIEVCYGIGTLDCVVVSNKVKYIW
ncbi:hypothetical protein LJB91_00050 [Bacteroidales bacterium OttesenSCG-928-L03]|nr:hypothetical protein [Bacteroidales bacterium OttesenSCG-928-L03]